MKFFPSSIDNLQLDIVGIVAILGESSISRNIQASGCSWFHILPRLMPAPQALLKNHKEKRLPTTPGIVVGAYSGRLKQELNFFTQLLHDTELEDFAVELVEVERKDSPTGKPPYSVKKLGHLAGLSVLGFGMSIALLVLSLALDGGDGAALLATILLSFTSTFVGLASKWELDWGKDKPNTQREKKIPHGDVVIFYPKTGAFRVVRCDEHVARMYFTDERCKYKFGDNQYRVTALLSTITLMAGLICLGNSHPRMQLAFAMSYILLNALHWCSSALNPTKHVWKHDYDVKRYAHNVPREYRERNMEEAVINLKGNARPSSDTSTDISASTTELAFHTKLAKAMGLSKFHLNRVSTISAIAREDDKTPNATSGVSKTQKTKAVVGRVVLGRAFTGMDDGSFKVEHKYSNMTSALWTTLALTGSTQWAVTANIVPDHEVWHEWLGMAGKRVAPKWSENKKKYIPAWTEYKSKGGDKCIELPFFNYQGQLSRLFMDYHESKKHRPIHTMTEPPEIYLGVRLAIFVVIKLKILATRARQALKTPDLNPSTQTGRNPGVHFKTADVSTSTSLTT